MPNQQYIKSNHFEYGVDTGIKNVTVTSSWENCNLMWQLFKKNLLPMLSKTAKVVHCLSSAAVLILSIMF